MRFARRLPGLLAGDRPTVLAAGLVASLGSMAVSVHALRALTLAQFGIVAIFISIAQLISAAARASLGETGLGAEGLIGVSRSRTVMAGVGGGLIGLTLALFVAVALRQDTSLIGPAALAAAGNAATEICRVGLIASGNGRTLLVGELLRLCAVVVTPLFIVVGPIGFLLTLAFSNAPILASALPHRGTDVPISWRRTTIAALDVFTQRGAGQIAALLVAGVATPAVFGAISGARLSFAPLTTLQSASANLVLVSHGRSQLATILKAIVATSVVYAGVLALFRNGGVFATVMGGRADDIRPLVLPMALFVVGSCMAPALATCARRIDRPELSLSTRAVVSAALLSSLVIVLVGLDRQTARSAAWAYGSSGLVAFGAWSRTAAQIIEGAENP